MAILTLRTTKGSPLTNQEVDDNFTNLNTELGTKLASSSYTAADVLAKLLTVDGTGSGIDADTLDGLNTASANTANTVVVRDASGNFSAGTITASLTGTASKATNLTGGLAGTIHYQSAVDTSTTLAIGSSGTYMKSTGTAPSWVTTSTLKTDLSLSNVENTALSTWAGTANITTLGTIGTGTWNATTIGTTKGGTGLTSFTSGGAVYATSTSALTTGTLPITAGGTGATTTTYCSLTANVTGTLPVANGGTGATTASAARTALGLAIGTDVQAYNSNNAVLNIAQSFTAKQTIASTLSIQQAIEKTTVSATAATGTVNFDVLTQAVLYYTSNSSGNWTLNIRGDAGTTLDSIMAVGESMTFAFMATNGGTAYYQNGFQIDGSSVTPKWGGGISPSSGNSSSIDIYTVTVIKTASATFTALASQSKFA